MAYFCQRCGYSSHLICDVKRHLRRATVCKPTFNNTERAVLLEGLAKSADKAGAKKPPHVKHIEEAGHIEGAGHPRTTHTKDEIIAALRAENEMLRRYVSQLEKDAKVVNNHVVVNVYGKENHEYINRPDVLVQIFKRVRNGIPFLIKHLHFNRDYPENMNIRITNKSSGRVEFYENDGWTAYQKRTKLNELIVSKHLFMESFYDEEMKSRVGAFVADRYEAMCRDIDEQKEDTMKPLRGQIENIIMQSRE